MHEQSPYTLFSSTIAAIVIAYLLFILHGILDVCGLTTATAMPNQFRHPPPAMGHMDRPGYSGESLADS